MIWIFHMIFGCLIKYFLFNLSEWLGVINHFLFARISLVLLPVKPDSPTLLPTLLAISSESPLLEWFYFPDHPNTGCPREQCALWLLLFLILIHFLVDPIHLHDLKYHIHSDDSQTDIFNRVISLTFQSYCFLSLLECLIGNSHLICPKPKIMVSSSKFASPSAYWLVIAMTNVFRSEKLGLLSITVHMQSIIKPCHSYFIFNSRIRSLFVTFVLDQSSIILPVN